MSSDPYKAYDKTTGFAGDVFDIAGAAGADFSNPMPGVQKAMANHAVNKYAKEWMKGMAQADENEKRANQERAEMNTQQAHASSMVYGQNGITEENGFVQDAEVNITYVGK
ncbi:hypothetical protein BDV19DRAFT_395338 [Aspergillus venezuelensis]